jgi:hypothetical protein
MAHVLGDLRPSWRASLLEKKSQVDNLRYIFRGRPNHVSGNDAIVKKPNAVELLDRTWRLFLRLKSDGPSALSGCARLCSRNLYQF